MEMKLAGLYEIDDKHKEWSVVLTNGVGDTFPIHTDIVKIILDHYRPISPSAYEQGVAKGKSDSLMTWLDGFVEGYTKGVSHGRGNQEA